MLRTPLLLIVPAAPVSPAVYLILAATLIAVWLAVLTRKI